MASCPALPFNSLKAFLRRACFFQRLGTKTYLEAGIPGNILTYSINTIRHLNTFEKMHFSESFYFLSVSPHAVADLPVYVRRDKAQIKGEKYIMIQLHQDREYKVKSAG